eukprot:gene2623-3315_t
MPKPKPSKRPAASSGDVAAAEADPMGGPDPRPVRTKEDQLVEDINPSPAVCRSLRGYPLSLMLHHWCNGSDQTSTASGRFCPLPTPLRPPDVGMQGAARPVPLPLGLQQQDPCFYLHLAGFIARPPAMYFSMSWVDVYVA